jgi:hypothetical protein
MRGISAFLLACPHCKQTHLSPLFGEFFVTASLGLQPFGPRCAVGANVLEVGSHCESEATSAHIGNVTAFGFCPTCGGEGGIAAPSF